MFRALTHPTYRLLFGSQVASLLGSGLLTVALSLQAYSLDPARASSVLGLIFTVKIIAYVVCSPFVKTAVAHLAPKRVLVGADLLRVGIAAGFAFVDHLSILVAAVFVLQLASAVYTPTYQSLLPKVLPDKQDYTGALSLARIAEDLEAIASPLIGRIVGGDDLLRALLRHRRRIRPFCRAGDRLPATGPLDAAARSQ